MKPRSQSGTYIYIVGVKQIRVLFRYKLLLEDVIKNTPESHPDKKSLIEALEQIEHVAWHINEQLREHENSMKMVKIILNKSRIN